MTCLIKSRLSLRKAFDFSETSHLIRYILTSEYKIPTLLNGWRHPYKDSMAVWVANGSRHTLGFAAVQNYNFLTVLNPIVWITLCSIYVTTLAVRRRSFTKSPSRQRPIRPYN